jgi:transposase-like protein
MTNNGKQRYCCKGCSRSFRKNPGTNAYSEERKEEILRAYHERTSLRGLTRIFGVSRQTVTSWLKKSGESATP